MQDRVPCRRQVPGDQAVEDVEAGRVLGIEAAVLTSPAGQPAELDGEDVLEDVRQEEHRNGHAEQDADTDRLSSQPP